MSFFLPYDLTPQGWLADMLLAQLRAKGSKELLKSIYATDSTSRVFNLHPDLKHELIKKIQENEKPWTGWASLNLWQYLPVCGSNVEWLERKKYVDFLMNLRIVP